MVITKRIDREPVHSLISLDELKQHVRQDDDYENDLISAYYLSAVDWCEQYTNRYFTETQIAAFAEKYQDKILLPYEINCIVSVKGNDRNGNILDLEHTYNTITNELIIDSKYEGYTDITLVFNTGYGQGELPPAIKQGILMLFGTLYEVREDVSYGVAANEVPLTSKIMLDSYRISNSI